MFACEWAGIAPDILCVGKALTGGMMTLSAVLANRRISDGISDGEISAFMHGPTFMGNPLACAVACASLDLLAETPWPVRVAGMEKQLARELGAAAGLPMVADVRALGAIGVIETRRPVDMGAMQAFFVEHGVWVRPFGRLVYVMPPYVMAPADLSLVTAAMCEAVSREELFQ